MDNGWIIFITSLEQHIDEYLAILIGCILVYSFVIRKIFIDIFDPLFLSIIYSILAMAVPIYMYFYNLMDNNSLFYSFISTELMYILGLLLFTSKKRKIKKEKKDNVKESVKEEIVWIYSLVYFSVNIFCYMKYGIPLLDFDNHVLARLESGFAAVIVSTILPVYSFLLIERIYRKQICFSNIILSIGLITTLVLSGSKSSLLTIIFSIYYFKLYAYKFNLKIKINFKKIYIYSLLFAIIGAFIPIIAFLNRIGSSDAWSSIIYIFITRVIGYGDIFAYLYGSKISDIILYQTDFWHLVIIPLAKMLRLVSDITISSQAIGFQVLQEIFNTNELLAAPNGRHNVFGLICFGFYGAPIYSFFIGMIISFFCRWCYKNIIGYNFMSFIIYISMYSFITGLSTESVGIMQSIIILLMINGSMIMFVYILNNKRIEEK